jgi:hypothetical protein
MNDGEFEGGESVDIIGGKYNGRHGRVDRLAGTQSVKIAIKNNRHGRTDYVTIRRCNVMRSKGAERTVNEGEDRDLNNKETIEEMEKLTRAMGHVSTDIKDLSKKMASLTKRMVRLKMSQGE